MLKNELKAGVILSYINLRIGSIIPFVYTPIMLRMLGQAEYGLFSLASSAVSYLSLLSFGFGSTIIRYISKYRAENDKESIEKTYGFFLALYSFLAVLVMICGAVIAFNIEPIFQRGLSATELEKMKILVLIMTVNSAISFPNSVVSSMVVAHEKYIFRRLVDMLATIAAPVANLIALYLGFASVGMATAATIVQISMMPLNIIYCTNKLNLKPLFAKMPLNIVKEMIGFSVFVFIGSIVDMLFWSTDKVILGMLTGSVAVAVYNVGSTFNSMVMNLSTSISGVLVPRVTGMVIKNANTDELTELFIRVGRLQFIIIALIVSGFTVFGRSFINLWAGPEYANAYWIAILTMFPLCVPLIQNTGLTIITAQNKHGFRAVIYLIIAIANVISTYIAVPFYGVIGAAACSCISYILGQGLIMNTYYYKVTGLDIPLFWKNILQMSIIPASMTIIGLFILNIIELSNWFIFLFGVRIFSLVYAVLMFAIAFNDYERNIFEEPFFKIMGKTKICK